tara:strand:+ start:1663 stop:2622 length:960 start_codon:yes stop_codon:yes gene_type:complete
MDAFRNYSTLYSGLNSATQMKDSAIRTVAESKAKSANMGKTLGEVKSFLSGQAGGKTFIKNVKPILKKRAEKLAEEMKAKVKAKLEEKVGELKQAVKPKTSTPPTDEEENADNVSESTTDTLQDDASPVAEENTATESNLGANDQYDEWDQPSDFNESYDSWDSPWGDDAIAESRAGTFSNPIANTRANKFNPKEQDSQEAMEPRDAPPSYQESVDEPATGAGNATDAAAQEQIDKALAEKMAGKVVEKTAGKTAAELGGEETGLSILDAIPGLDVLGFLGGGILAAIEAHKEKKEEEEGEEGATGTPGQAIQIGVGNE